MLESLRTPNCKEKTMHKVSTKRQITIPKELCLHAGINPGDMVEIFEYEGRITVVKKQKGISAGTLKHLSSKSSVSDEESLLDAVQRKHARQ